MIDLASRLVLALVCLLLIWGVIRQFVVSSQAAMVLDRFAIVPQWKFFAQQWIDGNAEVFDDVHLLVRTACGEADPGEWRELLHFGERPLRHALWNPRRYSRSVIAQHAVLLACTEGRADDTMLPSALSYLTVLRFCLDRTVLVPGETLQFAVATTHGRGQRDPRLRVLSAWHCP